MWHLVTRCPVLWGKWLGSVVSSVAGQFLWLNVYRMTQGHNSYQFAPPLGTRRNRGNLFSLARLSSYTETVFVLFDCIAPLGSLTLRSPSLFSLLLISPLSFFLSQPTLSLLLSLRLLFLSCLHVSIFHLGPLFPFLPPSFFASVHCHTGIKERSCCAVCLPAWLQGLLLVNEVIRRHSDLTKGICGAYCIFYPLFLGINIHLWWNGQMPGSLTCHYITQQISVNNSCPYSLALDTLKSVSQIHLCSYKNLFFFLLIYFTSL